MKQHVLYTTTISNFKHLIIELFKEYNIDPVELRDIYEEITEFSFFGKETTKVEVVNPTRHYNIKDYLDYLIIKGFWIDNVSITESISSIGSFNNYIIIVHKI